MNAHLALVAALALLIIAATPTHALRTSELRNVWGPRCGGFKRQTLTLPCRVRLNQVDVRAAQAFYEIGRIMAKHNYFPPQASTGAYNCRQIKGGGGSGYSLHAYGIAADFSWHKNPLTRNPPRLVTDMPVSLLIHLVPFCAQHAPFCCWR
jgi:hypothetical protein